MKDFKDKVVLVTGASSGIGRATAIAFAKEGAKVVVAARRINEGEETVTLIKKAGGEGIFIQTDVSQEKQVKNLVEKTVETYHRLDSAFNNAGFLTENLRGCLKSLIYTHLATRSRGTTQTKPTFVG